MTSRRALLAWGLPRHAAAWAAACALAVSVVLHGRAAAALDRSAEAEAAKAAQLAVQDHAAGDDDGAILRLQRARKACGGSRCTTATRAAILRDLGAFIFLRGEKAQASALYGEALDLVPDLGWNPELDAREASNELSAVKNERAAAHETPPEGDFEHVPVREQAVDTPLPIYAELNATGVAKVVVKYKVPGEADFKRLTLRRFGGGYGGTIPCQDVKRGLLRYFLQAFDADGVPLANSGDVRHLYFVPIRWALTGDPPHLPGQAPPEACNGQPQVEEPTGIVEAREPAGGAPRYVHTWIGVSGSVDLTLMPAGNNVCALTAALTPADPNFYCTNPDGSDYPTRSSTPGVTPVTGKSGDVPGGPASGDIRVLVTLDYATSTHFLTGVHVGYVAQSYPGAAASKDGHEISLPLHAELRETYLFGDEPLAHAGFAPYVFLAGGYAKTDVSQSTTTQAVGVAGPLPVLVWKMGGPFFGAAGLGARYAFSPRVAFLAGAKAAISFGSAGILPTLAPEVQLQYGF